MSHIEPTTRRRVLFLCTGNSCRSQLAEALTNHFLGSQWQAFSAGTHPAGYVHPTAIQVLSEIGIDHQGTSKSMDVFRDQDFDVVITVCNDAAENCPVWLGRGKRTHIGFADPSWVTGTPEEILAAFRNTRDQIREKVILYLQSLN
jgi:arsenate reductase